MRKLALLFLAWLPLSGYSAWTDPSGKPVPESESIRSSGNFGAQLVLTPDGKQFGETWNTSKDVPVLSVTHTVRRGSSLSAVVIFHGCAPNTAGVCDTTVEFALESPTGARTPAGAGPLWSGAPVQQRLLQLAESSMTAAFDDGDAPGEYKVIADIRDNVSGRVLSLVARFNVTP